MGICFADPPCLKWCRARAFKSSFDSVIQSFSPEADQRLHDRHPVSCSPRLSISMSSCLQWLQLSIRPSASCGGIWQAARFGAEGGRRGETAPLTLIEAAAESLGRGASPLQYKTIVHRFRFLERRFPHSGAPELVGPPDRFKFNRIRRLLFANHSLRLLPLASLRWP